MLFLKKIIKKYKYIKKKFYLKIFKLLFQNKEGIEFGGPTNLVEKPHYEFQLYNFLVLDGANLSEENYFQGNLEKEYKYGNKIGKQFNADVTKITDLERINKKYDFIFTSHIIEHIANPINALIIWKNILNKHGYLISIVPDYRFSFDRKRKLTKISHILEDFNNNIQEDDVTHISEQLDLHDWSLGGMKNFKQLAANNFSTRVVHHHTFIKSTLKKLLKVSGYKTVFSFKLDDLNIVNVAKLKK